MEFDRKMSACVFCGVHYNSFFSQLEGSTVRCLSLRLVGSNSKVSVSRSNSKGSVAVVSGVKQEDVCLCSLLGFTEKKHFFCSLLGLTVRCLSPSFVGYSGKVSVCMYLLCEFRK